MMISKGTAISNAAYAVGYEASPIRARMWPRVRLIAREGCSGEVGKPGARHSLKHGIDHAKLQTRNPKRVESRLSAILQ